MPSATLNRPKPDAGHLGHLGRPAPILPWICTRDGPQPVCRSGGTEPWHPTHVLTNHTRSQASPVPSGAGPGSCQAECCACPCRSPRRACQFLCELQRERCGRGRAGRPAAPSPSILSGGSSLSVAPAAAAATAPTSGSRAPPLPPQPMGPGRGRSGPAPRRVWTIPTPTPALSSSPMRGGGTAAAESRARSGPGLPDAPRV